MPDPMWDPMPLPMPLGMPVGIPLGMRKGTTRGCPSLKRTEIVGLSYILLLLCPPTPPSRRSHPHKPNTGANVGTHEKPTPVISGKPNGKA